MFEENRIPSAELADLFPGIEAGLTLQASSVLFGFRQSEMPLALVLEQWVMAAITRWTAARHIVEFGTAQGQTTFALAANSPPDAKVYTIDIAYDTDYKAKCLRGDTTLGLAFRTSPYADKIVQLLRDHPGHLPNHAPSLKGQVGQFHIDGDHSYDGVRSDTLEAFELAAPDAIFTWHDFYTFPDYMTQGRERRGVYPWLNELAAQNTLVLRHIVGTYLVVGSRRWTEDMPGQIRQPGEVAPPFGHHIVRLGETG